MVSGSFTSKSGIPALLIHGGAWAIPHAERTNHLGGLRLALDRGIDLLRNGAPALRTVAEVVAVLEDHPAFDAGRGAVLNRKRKVELDAGIMCGATLRYGAVAAVKRIKNPVMTALRLLEQEDGQVRFLAAEGAESYAHQHGLELVENEFFIVPREHDRYESLRASSGYHTSSSFLPAEPEGPVDTVGCVVRDAEGRLAAATSTGGTPFTIPGRVGDSPVAGAGFYANHVAAVSATGWGEAISASVCAARACDMIESGTAPDVAVARTLGNMGAHIRNPRGEPAAGGLIVVDASGRGAWAYTTPRMARAGWSGNGEGWVAL